MKRLKLIITAVLACMVSLTAMSEDRVFKSYPDNSHISSVYISKAAMRLGLSMAGSESNIQQLQEYIRNPEGMEVLSATSPEAIEIVKKDAADILGRLNMELLLRTSDGGEDVSIYTRKVSNENIIHDIIIESSEPNEYTLVYIRGEINADALIGQYKK